MNQGRFQKVMPRGDKSSYTDKQKRQAEHIEESYEKRGVSEDEAERRAWATVNKESGGDKKSAAGRKRGAGGSKKIERGMQPQTPPPSTRPRQRRRDPAVRPSAS